MNIFAVVKKSINSNLNKPLDVTLDEIKTLMESTRVTRKVVTPTGIPYVKDNNAQVLTLDSAPFLSIGGRGRILQIMPVSSQSSDNSMTGTTLLTVDDEIVLNNGVKFASSGIDGECIVNQTVVSSRNTVSSQIFGTAIEFGLKATKMYTGGTNPTFNSGEYAIVAQDGIPFNQGFEIRMTQDASQNNPEKFGIIVVYELYE